MLKITRCLVGETAVIDRGRPLLVELCPAFIVVGFKGRIGMRRTGTPYTDLPKGLTPNPLSLSMCAARSVAAAGIESALQDHGSNAATHMAVTPLMRRHSSAPLLYR
jgi:hypothetical protein